MKREAVLTLVRGLRSCIEGLEWTPAGTEWADYVDDNSYTDAATRSKQAIVAAALAPLGARTVWDLGANTGEYSRTARDVAPLVVSFDIDPAAVERNYRRVRSAEETGILPLLLDLANPSPAQGWAHSERLSLEQRGPADALLALALVHHLAIGRNLPLERVAAFLSRLGRALVIEFVPKDDVQVQRLLRNRGRHLSRLHRRRVRARVPPALPRGCRPSGGGVRPDGVPHDLLPRRRGRMTRGPGPPVSVPAGRSFPCCISSPPIPDWSRLGDIAIVCVAVLAGCGVVYALAALAARGTVGRTLSAAGRAGRGALVLGLRGARRSGGRRGSVSTHLVLFPVALAATVALVWWLLRRPAVLDRAGDLPDADRRAAGRLVGALDRAGRAAERARAAGERGGPAAGAADRGAGRRPGGSPSATSI